MSSSQTHQHYVKELEGHRFEAIPLLSLKNAHKVGVPYAFRSYAENELYAGDRKRVSRILNDISTLASSLPVEYGSSIFVKCDEDRYDVLKALIIGK